MVKDTRKANVTQIYKKGKKDDAGNYRLISLTLITPSLKVMEQITLGTVFRHMKDKKVIRNSHHVFTKQKSCFTNSENFYYEMTPLVDKG